MKSRIAIIILSIMIIVLSYVTYNCYNAINDAVKWNMVAIENDISNFDSQIDAQMKEYKKNARNIEDSLNNVWEKIVSNNKLCKNSVFYGKYELKDMDYLFSSATVKGEKELKPYISTIRDIRKIIDKNNSWGNLSDVSNSLEEINKSIKNLK